MTYRESDEFRRLLAHTEDLLARQSGALQSTAFLNPKEQYFLRDALARRGEDGRTLFFGGAPGAQRQKLFVLPQYIADLCAGEPLFETATTCLGGDAFGAICPLLITGGGFRAFSHRDYLGSLLALGIERSTLGDIVLQSDCSAIVFAARAAADLLCTLDARIASDRVRIEKTVLPPSFRIEQRFSAVSDTVASPRLDAVTAALGRLSRERAKDEIVRGAVECNYETEFSPDATVEAGDILTLHGVGKFEITDLSARTQKGRIRLCAKRYE